MKKLIGLFLLFPPSFVIADYFVLDSPTIVNAVSGYTGNLERLNIGRYALSRIETSEGQPVQGDDGQLIFSDAGSADLGISSIRWGEKGDKPCNFEISPQELNTNFANNIIGTPTSKSKSFCSGNAGDYLTVSVGSINNRPAYVRGINVCVTDKKNSSKSRLKGIALYSATLHKNEPIVRNVNGTPEKNQQRHCKNNWQTPVFCPNGYIATGIRIFENPNEASARGLGLRCKRVRVSSSFSRFVSPQTSQILQRGDGELIRRFLSR